MRSKQLYQLSSTYENATYKLEQWTNQLSNGKNVTLLLTTFYRRGVFTIELTIEEHIELINRSNIALNEYPITCEELRGYCHRDIQIQHKHSYTTAELREINRLFYWASDSDTDDEYDSSVEYMIDENVLHDNQWHHHDAIYGIHAGGCELNFIR